MRTACPIARVSPKMASVRRYPAARVPGGLELAAHGGRSVARAGRADDGSVPQALVAEIGFLHVRRLAGQYVAVLLLDIGKSLERIHARLLRGQDGHVAARRAGRGRTRRV